MKRPPRRTRDFYGGDTSVFSELTSHLVFLTLSKEIFARKINIEKRIFYA